jgi:putative transcriptional regulator
MAGEALMAKNELSNNIRRLRFDAGEMTQQALADKVGVTRQTIIATEQGRYAPSLPLAIKIARAFDKQVEEVFQLEG